MIGMESPAAEDINIVTLENVDKQMKSLSSLIGLMLTFQDKEQVLMDKLLKENHQHMKHLGVLTLGVIILLVNLIFRIAY